MLNKTKILDNVCIELTKERFLKYPNESQAKKIESLTGLDIDFSPSDQIWDEPKHVIYPELSTNNESF